MTLNQMAMWNTAKAFLGIVAISAVTNVTAYYLGWFTVGIVVMLGLIVAAVRMMYDMEKSKLERTNALTKIREAE